MANEFAVLGPVLPGSIVVLPDNMFETAEDGDDALDLRHREIMGQLAAKVGHNDFIVLTVSPDDTPLALIGRDEVKSMVRELLAEVQSEGPAPAEFPSFGLTRVGVSVPPNKTVEAFVPCGRNETHEPHVWDETETTCKACTGAATVLASAG